MDGTYFSRKIHFLGTHLASKGTLAYSGFPLQQRTHTPRGRGVGGSQGPCTSALGVDGEAEGTASGQAGRLVQHQRGFVLCSELPQPSWPVPISITSAHTL